MSDWYVERRAVDATRMSLAADIARHLQMRYAIGPALVLTERPEFFLSPLRKQWMKLARFAATQRSSTPDGAKVKILTDEIIHMQSLRFALEKLGRDADVIIAGPGRPLVAGREYATLYIGQGIEQADIDVALGDLRRQRVIVDYRNPPSKWD